MINRIKAGSCVVCLLIAFTIKETSQTIVLGNPSNAAADVAVPDNYLLFHYGFILSYNRSRGAANWVTWHLSGSDIGEIDRTCIAQN